LSESKLRILSAIIFLVTAIILGTLGLTYFENWSLFNALWVTLVSLTTTGYGDILPSTPGGRVFLLFILITGVGIVAYSLSAVTNLFVERTVSRLMEQNKMSKAISELNDHIIVCGAGRVGSSVARILKAENTPHILIDSDEKKVSEIEEKGHLVIEGDATQDEVLLKAGLEKAQGIVCALAEDAFNLFVTLTARDTNPSIKIVARAERPESIPKLRRAGADKIISPTQISGFQMAMAMLKPVSVDMVDTLFSIGDTQLQLEELLITDSSPLVDKEIKDVFGQGDIKVTVIAIIRDDDIHMNIRGNDIILTGDTLVLIGPRKDLAKVEGE